MQKISNVIQMFTKLFLIFLTVFVWVRYFVKSLTSSLLISAVVTFIIDIATRIIFKKKHEKNFQKSKEKDDAENMFISLATANDSLQFFKKLEKNNISSRKDYIYYTDQDEKVVLYPSLSFSPLSINDIAQIIKKVQSIKPNKVIIVTGEISKDCFQFINIFDEKIILYDKYDTYNKLYKPANTFPEIRKKIKKDSKMTMKELLAYSFNRSRSKGYIISACALLFCSLFVKATLYYTITTSILLIFAIISFTNPFSKYGLSKKN